MTSPVTSPVTSTGAPPAPVEGHTPGGSAVGKQQALPVLAIDPGNKESAYVVVGRDRLPLLFAKLDNEELLARLPWLTTWLATFTPHAAIEMVASYGMPVGAEVFETVWWAGRFAQRFYDATDRVPDLIPRLPVKLHHCGSARAKDSNIIQALVDRFAPGQPNRGKGTKTEPGWFHGFSADIWQAYALGVYVADTLDSQETP